MLFPVTCPLSDFCFSTVVTTPNLENLLRTEPSLSYVISRIFYACPFGVAETFYCLAERARTAEGRLQPLPIPTVMSPVASSLLVAGSLLIWGAACSMILTYFLLALSYCKSSTINNFICDRLCNLFASAQILYYSDVMFYYCHIQWVEQPGDYSYVLYTIFVTVMGMPSASAKPF